MLSPEGLIMPHTKSRSSKIGQYHKSQGYFNLSQLCQLLPLLHLWIFQNHSSTYVSYLLGTPALSLMSAILPFKHLKRLSPQLWSLPIDSRHSNYSQDWCLWLHTHPLIFPSWSQWWFSPHCIPLLNLFCPRLNYNVHEKELLAIFEAFQTMWHYHEGSGLLDQCGYWSLEFAILFNDQNPHTPQAWWSKYLSGFNLVIFSSQKTQNQTWHTHIEMGHYFKEE